MRSIPWASVADLPVLVSPKIRKWTSVKKEKAMSTDSQTSELPLHLGGPPHEREAQRDPDKEVDSDRVIESWDSLPGQEHMVDYIPTLEPVMPVYNTVEIRIVFNGTEVNFGEVIEGEISHQDVLEMLDRLNGSALGWLEHHKHQA